MTSKDLKELSFDELVKIMEEITNLQEELTKRIEGEN